ncbi:MAG: hypothetical protein IJU18_02835 [Oscillospiraceae bacterium]|nr:hypothetical protein [Oscillospiraceae bacterium]
MKKKLFSVFLALAMVLTLVTPMTVMAEDPADVSIGTAAELMDFVAASKSDTYAGKLVVLTADIDMTGITDFSGITNDTAGAGQFEGTFDGQGHTIRNLTWTVSGTQKGFFNGATGGAVIKNLTLENYTMTHAGSYHDLRVAFLVGNHGTGALTISNVHIVNGSYTNNTENGGSSIGGLVGASMGPLTIENSSVDADITIDSPSSSNSAGTNAVWYVGVGGILGRTANGNVRTIRNTSFTGTISAGRSVGGIFGANNGNTLNIENCAVNGTITAADAVVGGIGGYSYKAQVSNCTVNATINSTFTGDRNKAGGILGVASSASISDTIYDGDLTAAGGPAAAGGIVGLASSGNISVSRCEVFGTVHGTGRMLGGFVGNVWNMGDDKPTPVLTVTDSFCSADVVFFDMGGSAVGYLQSGANATATNCIVLRAHDTKGNGIHSIFAPGNADGTTNSATNCVIGCNFVGGDSNVGAQTYTVTTAQQLNAIARMSKYSNFKSLTLELANDISLNDADVNAAVASGNTDSLSEFPMIGKQGTVGGVTMYFCGVFDGKGHTVSGVYVPNAPHLGAGFFAWADGANCVIKDFTLANSYIHSDFVDGTVSRVGGIVGDLHTTGGSTVSGVTVASNVTVSAAGGQVGGIVGCVLGGATVTGCTFSGTVGGGSIVGGVVGYNVNAGTTDITNCTFDGTVTASGRNVGGIIGQNSRPTNITGCASTGSVSTTGVAGASASLGGVVGLVGQTMTITGLTDSATVTCAVVNADDIGGVIGTAGGGSATITNADVTADVTVSNGARMLGGFVGAIRGITVTVENSRFGGTVTSNTTDERPDSAIALGGVAGMVVNNSSKLIVNHFLMDGAIKSLRTNGDYIGGIAGSTFQQAPVEISDTLITGTVEEEHGQVGAFLGRVFNEDSTYLTGSITNSYALDSVCVVCKSEAAKGLVGDSRNAITMTNVESLAEAELIGTGALVNAPELDYDGYWSPIVGATPQLKTFQTGTTATAGDNLLERTGAVAPASIPAGKIFGGWYSDEACTVPVAEDYVGQAFARFVDADVLGVKSQQGLSKTAEGKNRLRVVTSVDSMDYQEVGFHVTYNNASGVEKTVTASGTAVYATLTGYTDPNTAETYQPTVFSSQSIRFAAFRLVASDAVVAQNSDGITIQPYWVTADGVTVEGEVFTGIKFN